MLVKEALFFIVLCYQFCFYTKFPTQYRCQYWGRQKYELYIKWRKHHDYSGDGQRFPFLFKWILPKMLLFPIPGINLKSSPERLTNSCPTEMEKHRTSYAKNYVLRPKKILRRGFLWMDYLIIFLLVTAPSAVVIFNTYIPVSIVVASRIPCLLVGFTSAISFPESS